MSNNVSPGVYANIISLSSYVQQVPSTIGMICALTKKGRDNQLLFLGSRTELISEFGEPNINDYGKSYGQGPYCAYNYLGESGALYFMRCMPDDASYSNILINGHLTPSDETTTITISYVENLETYADIKTAMVYYMHNYPLCMLVPIGRGEYYNSIGIRLTAHSNPTLNDVYVLDIYEKQSNGIDTIIESFEVSFDPSAKDTSGDSIWISYILETYSKVLRANMLNSTDEYSPGYDLLVKVFDKNIGDVSVVTTAGSATITDDKQVFSDWENPTEAGNATFMVIAKDSFGNKIYGWLGAAQGVTFDTCNVFNGRELSTASQNWSGDVATFKSTTDITYTIKKADTSVADGFTSSIPLPLKKGTEGSIENDDGTLDTTEATLVLSQGYAGLLTNPITSEVEDSILDTENVYYTMVFDCGYPDDVKTQVSNLVQTRMDCVAVIDNGDNATYTAAIDKRANDHDFNNYYTAIYEEYSKVNDVFTGQDIWVSPVYHMSYILPRNDRVAELWYAPAGFNRASIESIKQIRFSPKVGQRDQFYLKQINDIVVFNEGTTVWSQLTSQAKSDAMQDLNVVRLVLYIKRALTQFCKFYVFEMNDSMTWSSVKGEITAFLEDIKRRRGLYTYEVNVGATDYQLKTKTFEVDVILEPTRTTEKIQLNLYVK